MRVGNASVTVTGGSERDTGHVRMEHGAVYSLRLTNHDSRRRADTVIEVDGKEVGQFRIDAGMSGVIERPVNDTGRFTFLRRDSSEGGEAGLGMVSPDSLGLVRVTFRFEALTTPAPAVVTTSFQGGPGGQSVDEYSSFRGEAEEKTSGGLLRAMRFLMAPGGTGLTGESGQRFRETRQLREYDPSLETVISLRLVYGDSAVRPLTSTRGNQTPEAVG